MTVFDIIYNNALNDKTGGGGGGGEWGGETNVPVVSMDKGLVLGHIIIDIWLSMPFYGTCHHTYNFRFLPFQDTSYSTAILSITTSTTLPVPASKQSSTLSFFHTLDRKNTIATSRQISSLHFIFYCLTVVLSFDKWANPENFRVVWCQKSY